MRAMKDSGIEWIGSIPEHWEIAYLKRFCKVNSGREIEIELEQDSDNAVPVYGSGGVFKYTNKPQFNGEAVMFGRKGTLGKPIYANGRFWAVDTMYYLTFGNLLEARYCFYQLVAFNWEPYITQTALPSIVATDIVNTSFAFPPITEQQAIADYLDKKCAEVDEMIALQEQIIEELKAYKQSVITEAVTKGLNPAAPMRDSGIEWIGQIPEHWEVARLKFYASIDSGDAISNEQIDRDGEYPVFGGGEIMGYYSQYNTDEDKLIIGRVGARCGCVTMPKQKCWASDNALVLKSCLPLKYTYHLLQAINLNRLNTSNAQPLITATKVKNVFIPLTPPTEQQAIADYLDEKCADIDSLIQTKQSKIDILKEYKKSIIYEYVTGKREVE